MITNIRSTAFSLAVALATVFAVTPIAAFAQTAPACGWFWGINNQACGEGTVLTYVQVINRNNTTTYTPSNFIVNVQGQNPSLSTFPGSLQGTLVTLTAGGNYSMVLQDALGLETNYSVGCNGNVLKGVQALCVITVSLGVPYNAHPTPYPYPYSYQSLTCTPQYQGVAAGQTATFVALGGNGTYNWSTIENTHLDIGPVLNTSFGLRGTQSVTVTSGTQTANCTVDVTGAGSISYVNTSGSAFVDYPVTALTVTTQPAALPNTGFAPEGSEGAAFAVVALIALGLLSSSYVRKLFGIAIA